MKRIALVVAMLGLSSLSCWLANPAATIPTQVSPPVSAPSETTSPPSAAPSEGVAPAPSFDAAKLGTVAYDLTYCTTEGVDLTMDVYYPEQAQGLWPAALYVHGGAWIGGDKGEGAGFRDVSEIVARGYLVAAVNYRLAPEYRFPAMIEDVKCAVRHLRAYATEYNLDPLRIGAWDYQPKPISLDYLAERVTSLLRLVELNTRSDQPVDVEERTIAALAINSSSMRASWQGSPLQLTMTEFRMLERLTARPGNAISYDQLMNATMQSFVTHNTINTHMRNIRKKMEEIDPQFDRIQNEYGFGYRWKTE